MDHARPTPSPSPLAYLEAAFRDASRGPRPLAIDGQRTADDLPPRQIPLEELRRLLLHGSLTFETKDRVLGQVAARAKAGDEAWVVAFAGLLMPGLKRVARRLRRTGGVDAQEVGSEVVIGLLEALAHLDPCRDRIAATVCWEVYRRAHRATAQPPGFELPISDSLRDRSVLGLHPEEVLTRAVRAGVVTADEAELVALTRLEHHALSDLARSVGLPRPRLAKRRYRAEARIAELLRREAEGIASDAHRSWWPADRPDADFAAAPSSGQARPWRPRARLDEATPATISTASRPAASRSSLA
jgi:DNA-directed RNA polymerase specialized sigma24 family protein